MNKSCVECLLEKPVSDFYIQKYTTKSGVRVVPLARCKTCTKKRVALDRQSKWATKYKAYYQAYNSKNNQHVTGRKRLLREWLKELKKAPCTDCHVSFPPECMDFDHRDRAQKKRGIAAMVGSGQSKEAILAEIAKCDLLCANCHRIRTAKQLNWN